MVTQKSMVVKTKQFWLIRWLLKKVSWLKQNSFADSVVTQKSIMVKTKQFWLIRWLLKKFGGIKKVWLKQNSFG